MISAGMGAISAITSLFGLGNPFQDSLLAVVDTIVAVADQFNKAKGVFDEKNVPSKEWADGVGGAISMFATAISQINDDSGTDIFECILTGGLSKVFGGDKTQKFISNMIGISNALIEVGKIFNKNTTPFNDNNVPSEDWAKGVGGSIQGFATAMKDMDKMSDFVYVPDPTTGNMILEPVMYMQDLARGIISVGQIFNENKNAFKEDNTPTETWSSNVGGALTSWAKAMKEVNETTKKSFSDAIDIVGGSMEPLPTSLVKMGDIFNASSGFDETKSPSELWSKNVGFFSSIS